MATAQDSVTHEFPKCGIGKHTPKPTTPTPGANAVLTQPPDVPFTETFSFKRAREQHALRTIRLKFLSVKSPINSTFKQGAQVALDFNDSVMRLSDKQTVEIPNHIGYNAQVSDDGVAVKLCIDPHGLSPGRYAGSFRISDPSQRLQHNPVLFEFTLQENRLWLMIGILLASIVGGAFAIYGREQSRQGFPLLRRGQMRDFLTWANQNYVALVAGLGAALVAWNNTYFDNETWGYDGRQFLNLFLACAGATASSAVVGGIVDAKAEARRTSTEPMAVRVAQS